ncbi:MAG: heavy-metal-associated domain-containing protein [Thiobacillus sp.]
MQTISLSLTGLACGGCVASVQNVLTALPGVTATVTLTPAEARVTFDPARVSQEAVCQAVVDAGFGVAAVSRQS